MTIISCGQIKKYIFFPLFAGISKFISTTLLRKKIAKIYHHPLLLGIIAGLSMSFAFIPLIITKIKMKSSKAYVKEKLKLKVILLIVLCSFQILFKNFYHFVLLIMLIKIFGCLIYYILVYFHILF